MKKFESRVAPEFHANLFRLTRPTFNRVWPVVKTIMTYGLVRAEVAKEYGLDYSTLDSLLRPKIELITIPTSDVGGGNSVTMAYATEFEGLKTGVVYLLSIDFSKKVSMEIVAKESYTRYEKLVKGCCNE